MSRIYLDANFFISGFSDRPKDVHLVKEAADRIGMELWITRQVFQELRWYLRREVEQIISIDGSISVYRSIRLPIAEFRQGAKPPAVSNATLLGFFIRKFYYMI